MPKQPSKPPKWAPDRARWPAGFTPGRDGWYRWYEGRTRYVCARSVPIAKIPDHWSEKKKAADEGRSTPLLVGVHTYRSVLSAFLAHSELRVQRKLRPFLEQRTWNNYAADLNAFGTFTLNGTAVADMLVDEIGPEVFTAYAATFGDWSAIGFDSVVARIGTLFNWAVEMEYLNRYRPGPSFVRPGKQAIRDARIDLSKMFSAAEFGRLYRAANLTMKCWLGLGVCAAFINTDVAHVPLGCVDLETGIVDFRRRKTGKQRRVAPLPATVVDDLKAYRRPEASDERWADRFFLTKQGVPYNACQSTVTRLFTNLCELASVDVGNGRNFTGLRTTFFNLAPKSAEYEIERKIVMGRAKGTVDLDHYLEEIKLDRLRHVVDHVWAQISTSLRGVGSSATAPASSSAGEAAPAAT